MPRIKTEPLGRERIVTYFQFSGSVLYHSETSWTAARQASLSITNSQSLLKLSSIELVMPSNHKVTYFRLSY